MKRPRPTHWTRLGATLACLMALWPTVAARAESGAGTESPFVLGAGARVQAMGRAGTALADGPDAQFWNPARLGWADRSGLSLYRTRLFLDDIHYHAAAFAYPTIDLGTFALSYMRLDVDGIQARSDRNADEGTFDNTESNLLFGYARTWGPNLSFGGNFKIVQQSQAELQDSGFGLDLAVAGRRPLPAAGHELQAGLVAANILEPKIRLQDAEVPDPLNWKIGVGYSGETRGRQLHWALGLGADFPKEEDPRLAAGIELGYAGLLALRGGSDGGHPTVGFGIAWRGIRVDYAMRTDDELGRNDRFSLGVDFGPSISERQEILRRRQEEAVTLALEERLLQQEQQELRRLLDLAQEASLRGDHTEALENYERILLLHPEYEVAQEGADESRRQISLARASELEDEARWAEAAAVYQAHLRNWPGDAAALAQLEVVRARLRDASDRQEQLDELFRTAVERFADGELIEAEAILAELLLLDPDHRLARELAERTRQNRILVGEEILAEAHREADRNNYDLALLRLDDARPYLIERNDLDNLRDEWAAREQAALQREAAKPEAVVAERPAPKKELSPARLRELRARYELGLQAFSRGEFAAAIQEWRVVWVQDPDFEQVSSHLVKAYLYEGIALYGDGNYPEAIERCQRVLEVDPDNAKAQRYLARIREEWTEVEAK